MTPYTEKLHPTPLVWLLVPIGGVMAAASAYPLGAAAGIGAGVVFAGLLAAVLLGRAPQVRVDRSGLRAGTAFLERRYLGEIEALDAEQTRAAMGPQLRADAYVVHRGWVSTAVRIGVADEADPTPYWLISTRRPADLATALRNSRDAVGGSQP